MKGYMHYVHDIPDKDDVRIFPNIYRRPRKRIQDFRRKIQSINELQKSILSESNQDVFDFISEHLDLNKYFRHIIFTTNSRSYVDSVDFSNVRAIINFKPINHIRYLNEHFKSVNKLLPDAGIYIGRFQSYHYRKLSLYKRFGFVIGRSIWFVDFIFNRVIPRIRFLKDVYNTLTQRKYHVISQAETLGRLVYNGFEIIEYKEVSGLSYFVVIKTKEPNNHPEPSYHALIKLRRIGKGGKLIDVYKFRTMNPYSEYIQDFVLKLNGYNEVGKPANDFRVTGWGRLIRKIWLDEIPQFINVIKGEMKLFGVRPLSRVRFAELPKDIQQERIKYKPGCFPPYVALNMPDDKGNIEAERIYLRDKTQHPYITDIQYMCKALYNILSNKIRSS
ncbi:MAG: sugar transferase [Bacteroidales bacterium]|nr:sugar transferase [Bacteroidales bacterium]